MSRRLRYQVAVSLDGFIAGPNGEYDWIIMDPSIDFAKEEERAIASGSAEDPPRGQVFARLSRG
jgi:hypothetical protein